MKKTVDIVAALLCGVVVGLIAYAACEYSKVLLKSSGGVVLATELIYLDILPFVLAGVGAWIAYKAITLNGK